MPRARVRMLRCGWTAASSRVSWPAALERGDEAVVLGDLHELGSPALSR